MDFCHFLSSYLPDPAYGGKRLFDDMIEQARAADRLGYCSVTIPEHHIINILLTPDPLQMAVRVASETSTVAIITSVAVLPLHDMRILAGQVIQADILTDSRLVLGVGRGAFAYEMARLGSPIEESREKFDESLDVLLALLHQEEVEWHGKFYDFEPLTIMPRPVTPGGPPVMIATVSPEGIVASVRRGFNIQTTPLAGDRDLFRAQVRAFHDTKAELHDGGADLRLMLSRISYCARDASDARDKLERAYDYYRRFDNVFTGPGIVHNGCIAPLPRDQTIDELNENLLICPAAEMIDRLAEYDELNIDEVIFSSNLGQSQGEHIESMERFAAEVMPYFSDAEPTSS